MGGRGGGVEHSNSDLLETVVNRRPLCGVAVAVERKASSCIRASRSQTFCFRQLFESPSVSFVVWRAASMSRMKQIIQLKLASFLFDYFSRKSFAEQCWGETSSCCAVLDIDCSSTCARVSDFTLFFLFIFKPCSNQMKLNEKLLHCSCCIMHKSKMRSPSTSKSKSSIA